MSLDLTLTFDGHRVRMVGTPEVPLWVAKDVCRVLGLHGAAAHVARDIPEAERGSTQLVTPGGPQTYVCIREAGLFRLISRSRKPAAARFQSWLFGEVLPSIRRHGCFPPPPERASLPAVDLDDPGSLRGLVEAFAIRRLADMERIAELQPKAEALALLAAAQGERNLQTAGRELGRPPNLFIEQLIADGVLFRGEHGKPMPFVAHLRAGYFRVIATAKDGLSFEQTMVTTKGLVWLAGRYPAAPAPAPRPLPLILGTHPFLDPQPQGGGFS